MKIHFFRHSSRISSAQKSPMTSCYKPDIEHCHHYRELYWKAFQRWGIPCRGEASAKVLGSGTLWHCSSAHTCPLCPTVCLIPQLYGSCHLAPYPKPTFQRPLLILSFRPLVNAIESMGSSLRLPDLALRNSVKEHEVQGSGPGVRTCVFCFRAE